MKKLNITVLILLVSLFIFAPQNVFADSFSYWKIPYKNTNYNSYDSWAGFYGTYTSGLNPGTDYTTCSYFTDSAFTRGAYDYVEIPISVHIDSSSNVIDSETMTVPNADTMYYVMNDFNFQLGIWYANDQYDAYSDCTISSYVNSTNNFTGIARCNVNRVANGVRRICLKHNINGGLPTSYGTVYALFFGTNGWFNFLYKNDNGSIANSINSQTNSITNAQQATTDAVNNNTSAINSVNATLNDDSTTSAESTGSSFFSNFRINNFGLTAIVTAPITFIQSFTNTCHSVPLTIYGKEVPLPCGTDIFWNRADVQPFRIIWNLLVGGPIIYALGLKLFRSVHKALDPDENEEGGLDL